MFSILYPFEQLLYGIEAGQLVRQPSGQKGQSLGKEAGTGPPVVK